MQELLEYSGIYAFFMNGVLADRFYKTSAVYSLIGKFSYEILTLAPLVILSFKRKLGEPTMDFLICFYALFILGWCIFDIFKKEGGLNEEV